MTGLSIEFVQPDRSKVIFLDRASEPADYLVIGRTRCMRCDQWCHLSADTLKIVQAGFAEPWCLHCGRDVNHNWLDSKIGDAAHIAVNMPWTAA